MLTRLILLFALSAIVGALFLSLLRLMSGRSSEGVARALTLRISLSIGLFLLLMAGHYFGLFPRQGP